MTDNIQESLLQAAKAYNEGTPIMSDAEYDALLDQASLSEGYVEPVGGGYVPESRKVTHTSPMLSLSKVYTIEELQRWIDTLPPHSELTVDHKYDGLPIQAVVVEGRIIQAATRGDGFVGEDVLGIATRIPDVRNQALMLKNGLLVGEVMLLKHNLVQINNEYDLDYANTRNAAVGILRGTTEKSRDLAHLLSFFPHEKRNDVAGNNMLTDQAEQIVTYIKNVEQLRDQLDYNIDGMVVKVVQPEIRQQMGASNYSPRWARAYKFESIVKHTRALDIEWSVGRTGRVIPTLRFEPVQFVGKTEYATLHNALFVKELGLGAGDDIEIKHAGDVIPYFNGVVQHNLHSGGTPLRVPEKCPNCEYALRWEGVHVVCDNKCSIEPQLVYALSVLGVDGLGPGVVAAFYEHDVLTATNIIGALRQVLSLTIEDIENIPGFGQTSAIKIVGNLSAAREADLASWIASIGLPGIAYSRAVDLANHFGSIHAIMNGIESIAEIPGFGQAMVTSIYEGHQRLDSLDSLLHNLKITPKVYRPEISAAAADSRWNGKKVVITGVLPTGLTRDQAGAWLESMGAELQSGVSSKTDILVAGEKAGSKLAKAQSLGVSVVTGEDLVSEMQ